MIIIGAGMSGLLCGALNPGSIIYEAGPERESDHKALFRCKSDQIGKVLGIPFKKVEVYKSIWLDSTEVHSTPRIAHMYSQKVAGKISGRSITNIESGPRYIPPDDFIDQLKARCYIKYDTKWPGRSADAPTVSTMPLFRMMNMVDLFDIKMAMPLFESKPIYVTRVEIPNCDSYCTIYYPDHNFLAYRASLTGNILTIEGMKPILVPDVEEVLKSFGIFDNFSINQVDWNHKQTMGKITPIDNKIREKAITEMTLKYGIYSLGRFATWRPKVMLDDVLEDIWHINRLIQGGNYAALNHKQSEE